MLVAAALILPGCRSSGGSGASDAGAGTTARAASAGSAAPGATAIDATLTASAADSAVATGSAGEFGDWMEEKTGTLWSPALEWELEAELPIQDNPFDVRAVVTFKHGGSGEERQSEMFYVGENRWKFRFASTQTGRWSFTTESETPALDGRRGVVRMRRGSQPHGRGFVTSFGSQWGWSGTGEVFVPQLVMARSLRAYHDAPGKIKKDIRTFIGGHGFTGFHLVVKLDWFGFDLGGLDLGEEGSIQEARQRVNPDPEVFETLERFITAVYEAGGMTHIWLWGSDAWGHHTGGGEIWGKMSPVHQRLYRYIAARLGPLPGWTMGYGYDLWEEEGEKGWVQPRELQQWKDFMEQHLGWDHMFGGRIHDGGSSRVPYQAWHGGDYAGYESFRPDLDTYLDALLYAGGKPALMEDRFRVRDSERYEDKDYTTEMTRRGLWRSALAGGVGNIWGYLLPEVDEGSGPYPNRAQIKTYARFFEGRFRRGLRPCNGLTTYRKGGTLAEGRLRACLCDPDSSRYVFYAEDTDLVRMDLSGMLENQPAVAVDVLKPYAEYEIGPLDPRYQTWAAPYPSTWAIAVGRF